MFHFREKNKAKMMVYILKPVVLYETTGLYALYVTLMLFPVTTDNWEILPYQTHYTSNYTTKLKNTRKNKVNHKCSKVLQAHCLFASFQNFVINYVGKVDIEKITSNLKLL